MIFNLIGSFIMTPYDHSWPQKRPLTLNDFKWPDWPRATSDLTKLSALWTMPVKRVPTSVALNTKSHSSKSKIFFLFFEFTFVIERALILETVKFSDVFLVSIFYGTFFDSYFTQQLFFMIFKIFYDFLHLFQCISFYKKYFLIRLFKTIMMMATILHLAKTLVEVTVMVRNSTKYLFNAIHIIDSLCIWYAGDTTGSDDSQKSDNNSGKNSRLALSIRSGSNLSRSYKSTAGSGTGSPSGN